MVRMIVFGFVFIAGLKFGVGFWFELMKQAGGPCEPPAGMLPRLDLLGFWVWLPFFGLVGVGMDPGGRLHPVSCRLIIVVFFSLFLGWWEGSVDFTVRAEG